jgi:phosphate transport system permease protein
MYTYPGTKQEKTIAPEADVGITSRGLGKRRRPGETVIQGLLFLAATISILTTIGIVFELGKEALLFFQSDEASVGAFLTGTNWQPALLEFGIWPLVLATLMTSVIAMLVALPLGLAAAVYLSEYASDRVRGVLKPVLEVLAGIPTVVYGYFALTFMTPLLRVIFGDGVVQIFNSASAGIVVGILIIPLVSSMSEDALHAVPVSLREAAYGLGATKLETSTRVVFPAALSGITAAFVVAISRAIGETMVVAIAAGAGPKNFTLGEDSLFGYILNPFEAAETMTGHIVRISGGDISYNSIDYNSIFAIGLALFVITLALNVLSRRFVARFREVYE